MAYTYLHILPIVVFVWFPLTFILTFVLSVLLGHVNPLFPYISDTGTFSPESCVFGQLINLGLIVLGFVLYIRYRQVRELYQHHNLPLKVQKLNFLSIIFGLLGSLGLSIVANFQETNTTFVHMTGAIAGFGFGMVYVVMQTILAYKLYPMTGKKWILQARIVLSSMCVTTFIFCLLFAGLAIPNFKGSITDMTKWAPADGGWELHVVSAICEWLTAIIFMLFILTFSPEFRSIKLSEPTIHIEDTLLAQTESCPVT